jgi:hypothetical protein
MTAGRACLKQYQSFWKKIASYVSPTSCGDSHGAADGHAAVIMVRRTRRKPYQTCDAHGGMTGCHPVARAPSFARG